MSALLLAACVPEEQLKRQLAEFNVDDPAKDAAEAIAAGRPRCYSISGYATSFPGLSSEEERTFCRGHEINIKGTSDMIESAEHEQLIQKAKAYATVYNRYMVDHALPRAK